MATGKEHYHQRRVLKDSKSGNVFNRDLPTTNTADRNNQKIFFSSSFYIYVFKRSDYPQLQTDTN